MQDHDSVRQRIAAFDKKHGADGIEINGMIYYSNGALRDVEPMGVLCDPPADLYERSKLIVSYWQGAQRRVAAEFEETKQLYLSNAKAGLNESHTPALPWTEEQAVKKLTELRDKIRQLQTRVAVARAELKRHAPPEMAARAEHFSEARQRATSFLNAVDSIKI